jgi:hypothetical protein
MDPVVFIFASVVVVLVWIAMGAVKLNLPKANATKEDCANELAVVASTAAKAVAAMVIFSIAILFGLDPAGAVLLGAIGATAYWVILFRYACEKQEKRTVDQTPPAPAQ